MPLAEGLPEVAWDGDGRWCGDGPPPAGGIPLLEVAHIRTCRGGKCGTFVCAWCRRAVPWCFGAGGDDGLDGRLCDDCWCELHEGDDAEQARRALAHPVSHAPSQGVAP